ncbi:MULTISPECIES: glycosyltransferase family 2 protein [Sphingobacterium]|uniref:Glycosyltransferase involved in cell wall biosynthesis n=1 Tax=Sphingobacterium siyangense TaxID=459529 RepID=A0A562MJ73_9SPHI|nr:MULTISPECIES: glycosyltransferase family 2 protein [Sphingobacterium]TWI19939.1 glycosyltransferase involved in cell wall biosynthesis [Sphingobacterium siyangense]
MKITIITAVYNNRDTIQAMFDSIREQTYLDIEHIVIDGNSSDGTKDIIAENKSHIAKYVSEKDAGLYDALNKGINLASGDVVGILNADDLLSDKYTIERVASSFNQNDELDAIYGDVIFFNKDGKVVRKYSSKYFYPWMFRFGMQPAHPSFYVKRHVFSKLGLYNPNYKIAGDFELMLRYLKNANIKYNYIPFSFVKMRIGGLSTSGVKSTVLLNKEILSACQNNGLYTNQFLLYLKYTVKWWGFVFKR